MKRIAITIMLAAAATASTAGALDDLDRAASAHLNVLNTCKERLDEPPYEKIKEELFLSCKRRLGADRPNPKLVDQLIQCHKEINNPIVINTVLSERAAACDAEYESTLNAYQSARASVDPNSLMAQTVHKLIGAARSTYLRQRQELQISIINRN